MLSTMDGLPPARDPKGNFPDGVNPFKRRTLSDSSLSKSKAKTLAIFPTALILFLMASFLSFVIAASSLSSGMFSAISSSSEQMLKTLAKMSVVFSATNGNDQVNTSMKLGSQ